ncbi:probable ARO1 - Pentafunctional AROM polypeptide [Melanopsichium pennsylvanicum]|uniref:Pentafunctional AROM polypeptide n=2 Tax=Melanopsichium pennsylvanicum TaxID=63383 RepID=A0AAJ5C6P4_9BASI|nr:probable ARO1-Pentafunctional AROM polypeptide [Melanopsichium pennsylvanicum 4]SNX86070.1 probable ARO1 - Pentafunctional AROM polypeptide [Melanopsichium pennsylvanicum]
MASTQAAQPVLRTKTPSYHAPPSTDPLSGATIHTVRCLDTPIHLGYHLIPHIAKTLLSTLRSSTYVLITDQNLESRCSVTTAFRREFENAAAHLSPTHTWRLLTKVIPPGEQSKSREGKNDIEDWMLEHRVTRDAVVLAVGGGVIGDLVGFVAATFMRGLKFVQIPTTLLAMVDSSVGGKTAIDHPLGKNLIGSFHQPNYVFIDAAWLKTLPPREFSNGMAEVVKTAAIWDPVDFAKLESSAPAIRSAVLGPFAKNAPIDQGRTLQTRTESQSLLLDVIRGSVGVKAHIVTIDEKETGLRNLVNFGHTIGHAIEAVLTPEMLHGECISIGMILEAEVARYMHGLSQVAIGRLTRCLKEYDLPVALSDSRVTRLPKSLDVTIDRLLDIMKVDKKNSGSNKKIVLLSSIGDTVEDKASTVSDDIIRRVLSLGATLTPVLEQPNNPNVVLSTPGSKSISNRALVLAALAGNTCRLRNMLHSDDTQVMMAGLHDLQAARFEFEDGGETIVVHGNNGALRRPDNNKQIYLQNAGTAARFMATVVTLVENDANQEPVVITGNKRMKERPIGALVDALRSNGTDIEYLEGQGCLPLAVKGTEHGFKGGKIQLAATISSQYVSSILLCAPYAAEEVVLELVGGQVISQLYIDMTIAMMATFGIKVERLVDSITGRASNTYRIPRGHYVSPEIYDIESDASSATYPLAIAAITGTECTIPNIGSASLQGDARFAKEVLEPMGCTVHQTATSTTVIGPKIGQLRQIGLVDMEPMTDAFLTASVLLAVAAHPPANGSTSTSRPSTRITGIANQRVKECNRIRAMMDELAKFGVDTKEHEDGLEIFGIDYRQFCPNVRVHCYDDHRVAMAFSVLASLAPGAILEEKRCVEKTWPNWWDDLERKLGIHAHGVDPECSPSLCISPSHFKAPTATSRAGSQAAKLSELTMSKALTPRKYPKDATIICIGMRASGKTFLGAIGAAALGRHFIDADVVFNEKLGAKDGLGDFVKQHGWPAFRQMEMEILQELVLHHPTNALISLGGGVVETEACREILAEYAQTKGPVVYIVRDTDAIVKFLANSDRPAYGEPVMDVYCRRNPWFSACSSVELVSYSGGESLAVQPCAMNVPDPSFTIQKRFGLENEVARFFNFVTGQDTNQIHDLVVDSRKGGRRTYFLSLTFPDVVPKLELIRSMQSGADALEFRADLLNPTGEPITTPQVPPADYVKSQLAALRHRTSLPIVFTVRTSSQGGMFPDHAHAEYFEMVSLAIRHGCEYIDLELGFDDSLLAAVNGAKGNTQIIASHHDWSGKLDWESDAVAKIYQRACKFGDVAKIIGKANTMEDNYALERFRDKVSAGAIKPLLAVNMGAVGQFSRIVNPVFTPITHEAMPVKAAPGQLSFKQVQTALSLIGQTSPFKFALFGSPISHSLSPLLHNTAFKAMGLPHQYELLETAEVDEAVETFIKSPEFGGASVTIPHKLAIMKHLDQVSDEAKAIGAVNTVIPIRNAQGNVTSLVGDNTDWIAIESLARRSLRTVHLADPNLTGLVIGAGGSARAALFALYRLGVKRILLFNRTLANAEALAKEVPIEWNVVVISSLDEIAVLPVEATPSVVVSNIPAEGTTLDASAHELIHLPKAILSNPTGGVVIDMSYKPYSTSLMQLAQQVNTTAELAIGTNITKAPKRKLWSAVPGITILLEQGCHQFQRWTGREAPRAVIEEAAWEVYLQR